MAQWKSIGSQIQSMRTSRQRSQSEQLSEGKLREVAKNLLRPKMVKVQKSRDGIIKPVNVIEALRTKMPKELNITTQSQVHKLEQSQRQSESEITASQCFEIDFNWLEYCDNDHFQKLLKDDLLKISNMEQYVDENQAYLCHVFAQCACAKCTCNKCVCPFKKQELPQMGMVTTQQWSYSHKQPFDVSQLITQAHYDNLQPSTGNMLMHTTSREAYKNHNVQRRIRAKSQLAKPRQFFGKTSQNTSYVNWKDYRTQIFHAPQHKSIVGDTLNGSTIYKNAFQTPLGVHQIDQNYIKEKQFQYSNLLFSDTYMKFCHFQNHSTYKDNFKKTEAQKVVNYKPPPEKYEPIGVYDGQFQTQHQQEFIIKNNQSPLVQQKPWKSKLLKKLEMMIK